MGKRFKKKDIVSEFYTKGNITKMKFTKAVKEVFIPSLNEISKKYTEERKTMIDRMNLIIAKQLLEISGKGTNYKDLARHIFVILPIIRLETNFPKLMKILDDIVGICTGILNDKITDENINKYMSKMLTIQMEEENGNKEKVMGGNT